jgi:hypothetical protein
MKEKFSDFMEKLGTYMTYFIVIGIVLYLFKITFEYYYQNEYKSYRGRQMYYRDYYEKSVK